VDAGFSVSKLKVTTTFKDVKVQNDAHVTLSDQSFHFLNVSPQTLSGTKTVVLVDKNFVSSKDYKKYSKLTSLQCYESGKMNGQRSLSRYDVDQIFYCHSIQVHRFCCSQYILCELCILCNKYNPVTMFKYTIFLLLLCPARSSLRRNYIFFLNQPVICPHIH
jgi:hypothetical protein